MRKQGLRLAGPASPEAPRRRNSTAGAGLWGVTCRLGYVLAAPRLKPRSGQRKAKSYISVGL
jgi:hypothetical protein